MTGCRKGIFSGGFCCNNACRAEKRRPTMPCGAIWGGIKRMGQGVPNRKPVVVLDEATGGEHRYGNPIDVIRAESSEQLAGAFAAIARALGNGHHVAGYFSYELGYVFERKLLPLLPASRSV